MAKICGNNVKVVGLFGQSGAGKTTIIRSLPDNIGGCDIRKETGVIRSLFTKNPTKYSHPIDFISQKDSIMAEANPGSVIAQMYEKYIKSQFQLLHDFSSEAFELVRYPSRNPSIAIFDRCPMDFHSILTCGFDHLRSVFGGKVNKNQSYYLDLEKNVAVNNTINMFDVIFIVKPWTSPNTNGLTDGVRDQYLSSFYTGENWYNKLDGIDFGGVKFFTIDESMISLQERTAYITEKLKTI